MCVFLSESLERKRSTVMSFDEGSGGRGNGSLSVVVSDEDEGWVLTLRVLTPQLKSNNCVNSNIIHWPGLHLSRSDKQLCLFINAKENHPPFEPPEKVIVRISMLDLEDFAITGFNRLHFICVLILHVDIFRLKNNAHLVDCYIAVAG